MDELKAEDSTESHFSRTVNGMMSEGKEKNWNILSDASFGKYHFQIILVLKSSKEEVRLSRTRLGLSVLRQC